MAKLEKPSYLAEVARGGLFDIVENKPANFCAQHVVVTIVLPQSCANAVSMSRWSVNRRSRTTWTSTARNFRAPPCCLRFPIRIL
jgi:hypothetical protein